MKSDPLLTHIEKCIAGKIKRAVCSGNKKRGILKRTVKIIICVVLVAAMLAGTALCCCAYPAASGSDVRGKDVLNGKNWMSGIADERYLCEINLPGTHDSATAYCRNTTENHVKLFGNNVFDSGAYAKTQSLTLPQQLNAGVRYLDLRFSPGEGELLLCHGNNEKAAPVNNAIKILTALNPLLLLLAHFDRPFLSLDIEFYAYEDEACTIPLTCSSVLAQVKTFLRENPSETVIITAKKRKRRNGSIFKALQRTG
ncbi:MAG: hypothetical protein IKD72_06405 [Clostridia bacterium]|nr:hypothetical protein [Clostridia bacterium]